MILRYGTDGIGSCIVVVAALLLLDDDLFAALEDGPKVGSADNDASMRTGSIVELVGIVVQIGLDAFGRQGGKGIEGARGGDGGNTVQRKEGPGQGKETRYQWNRSSVDDENFGKWFQILVQLGGGCDEGIR